MNKKSEKPRFRLGDFNQINRSYNARMRDVYYLKFEESLTEFTQKLKQHPLAPDIPLLNRQNNELSTTVDFAKQAISGALLGDGGAQESDREPLGGPAYFKEEVLFINLLEELHSSGIFLFNRFKTIYELHRYKVKIRGLIHAKEKSEGYLSKILHFINENQKAEDEEIKQIIALILERRQLSRRIFDIIKTRKG
jgi:hypothetical protein